jgi:hypothetical protein
MAHTEAKLIEDITAQIAESFTVDDDEAMDSIKQLATEIIKTIKAKITSMAPKTVVKTTPVASKSKGSTTKSGEKRKGNAYSHFTSVVAAQARKEDTYESVMVTPIERKDLGESSSGKNIIEHQDQIEYGTEMSFSQFFDMVSGFEQQPMKRAGIMWRLLSDDDRKLFAADE